MTLESLLSNSSPLKPNFGSTYSVTIAHPIDVVFDKLGRGETLEETVKLSDLCHKFEYLQRDHVGPVDLTVATGRTLPAIDAPDGFPRQYFLLHEQIPMLFGMYKHITKIMGCMTTDESNKVALYESVADAGVYVRKLRTFREVSGGTEVMEVIEGQCSRWLQMIVDKETKRSHKAHMDEFNRLFA